MTERFPPEGYVLRIKNWDDHFERAQTRKVEGPLAWVAIPTKHDGLKFSRLLARQNGLFCLGAFLLLVEVGAKTRPRGLFLGSGGDPLTTRDLAAMTGARPADLNAALQVLSSNEIGWIEVVSLSHLNTIDSVSDSRMRIEENREEKNRIEEKASAPAAAVQNRPRDARLDCEVIQVVRDILGKYPNKIVWDEIIEKASGSFDEVRLRYCAKEWSKVSGNMFNLTWLLEWYVHGIPERRNGNGKSEQQVSQRTRDSGADSGSDRFQFVRKPKPVV